MEEEEQRVQLSNRERKSIIMLLFFPQTKVCMSPLASWTDPTLWISCPIHQYVITATDCAVFTGPACDVRTRKNKVVSAVHHIIFVGPIYYFITKHSHIDKPNMLRSVFIWEPQELTV